MGGANFDEVGPEEAMRLVSQGAFFLDVREPEEWEAGRAPQAHHIPLGQLEQRLAEIPEGATVLCVCRMGGRSARAAGAFTAAGYSAVNLAGGMLAWQAAQLPLVREDGSDGTVL